MEYTISVHALRRLFPDDTLWWTSGAEIVGYSPSTYKLFVVDDGTCWDDIGCWLVHGWRLKEPWDFKSPIKYVDTDYDEGNGVKILERWVMFRNYSGDIAPVKALYEKRKDSNGAILVFVKKDGCYYTFGKDAERVSELLPGFPVAYIVGEPIIAIDGNYWPEVRQSIEHTETKIKTVS